MGADHDVSAPPPAEGLSPDTAVTSNPNPAPYPAARLWRIARAPLCGLAFFCFAVSTSRYPELVYVVLLVLVFVPFLFMSGRYLLRKQREREAVRKTQRLPPAALPDPMP